jgi:hypothetical protein
MMFDDELDDLEKCIAEREASRRAAPPTS